MSNGLEMMLSTEVEILQAENTRLREELAAAHATIAQMREALHYALQAWHYDGISDEHGSIYAEADRRCDAHTNQDALHEARAQALEAAVKEFHPAEQFFGIEVGDMLMLQAAAHRAKKGEGK